MKFQSRIQAGEKLGRELKSLDPADPVVLAIPRGGVPVGAAVARTLSCPLDVIPLVKIPIPWCPEASYGAVAMDGTMALNLPLMNRLEVSMRELELAAGVVMGEAKERDALYRESRPFPSLENRTVILVDDGLGSGFSMLAAVQFARERRPAAIIVAAPVASHAAFTVLGPEQGINAIIVLRRDDEPIFNLPSFFKEWTTVTDEEVKRCLSGGVLGGV